VISYNPTGKSVRIMREKGTTIAAGLILLVSMAAVLVAESTLARATEQPSARAINVAGDVEGTHDPSIIKEGDTWYLFGTTTERPPEGELPIRCSKDLQRWQRCGYVLPAVPDWIKKESPETKELWAPDISYFNGEYHLYYAFSVFGKNTSGIALLTNKTLGPSRPQFRWIDRGLVLRSLASDDFNAIDPNVVIDAQGRGWLAFGSFWSGIKMRRIDPKSGKLSTEDTKLYSLASRRPPADPGKPHPDLPPDWQAVEGPFIVHHDNYYYLFVSFDLCCRGTKSTYRTMVGRSEEVAGPYVDAAGKAMMTGGGTPLLEGNSRWKGPGGESVLLQKDQDLIVFHAYDGTTGNPSLQVSTVAWVDGWPRAALEDNVASPDK
jgi:arabinan endo-1,5-alpha-L-arabinosidase